MEYINNMKTLIIYDSMFGNTQKVAEEIKATIKDEVRLIKADEISMADVKGVELLIVGSPTQGGRPTAAMQDFIKLLFGRGLVGMKVAVFDTRLEESKQNFALKLLMKTIGYAADKMAVELKNQGANLIKPPAGFMVTGKKGPLKEGETERVGGWATELLKLAQN
jgi:flavodoxin I